MWWWLRNSPEQRKWKRRRRFERAVSELDFDDLQMLSEIVEASRKSRAMMLDLFAGRGRPPEMTRGCL